jgi:hypothetical protein
MCWWANKNWTGPIGLNNKKAAGGKIPNETQSCRQKNYTKQDVITRASPKKNEILISSPLSKKSSTQSEEASSTSLVQRGSI